MQEKGLLSASPLTSTTKLAALGKVLTIAVYATGLICPLNNLAQGIVYFANHVLIPYSEAAGYDVLIRGADGTTPIVGTNFMAQLYYGASPDNLLAATGTPRPFRVPSTTLAGTWMPANKALIGFAQGSVVVLAVKVWDGNFGSTYEQAMVTGGMARDCGPFYYQVPYAIPYSPTNFYMFGFRANNSLERCPTNRPPIIETQPLSINAVVGSTITLAPDVRDACLFQWRRNGADTVAFQQTLSLTNVQPAHAGDYQLIAGNYTGSVTSEVATVTVVVPPQIGLVARTNEEFRFFVPGEAGAWVVETATNLNLPASWLRVHTNRVPFWYTNFITPGDPLRFYRVVLR
ncbi:MAG: immunoglobulin domain-containing protein [Verrucomicrobia subdivision 3 bacterium]|nr:immunoglobulin domain-containing protein [Limisphaerales bacterium]